MSHFEAICTFLFLIVILLGIVLTINFNKKPRVAIGVILSSLVIILTLVVLLFINQSGTREKAIKQMIRSHNGTLIKVSKVEGNQTPFGTEVEQYNSVYEISYRIEDRFYTAWYRSVDILVTNVDEDLTSSGRSSARFYKQAWIFNE